MLKGVTKIILTNEDGSTQEYEDTNMITNATYNLINLSPKIGLGNNTRINPRKAFEPLYLNAFGGILLWNEHLTEDANNILPQTGVKCVGHAGNSNYVSTDPFRGVLNESESGPTENGYKFVWDFQTHQAVGTIKAVSLTSRDGGSSGFKSYEESYGGNVAVSLINDLSLDGTNLDSFPDKYLDTDSMSSEIICNAPDTAHAPVGSFADGIYSFIKATNGATGFELINRHYRDKIGLKTSYPYQDTKMTIPTTKKMIDSTYLFSDENYVYSIYPYNINKLDIVKIDCVNFKVLEEITLTVQDAEFTSEYGSIYAPFTAYYDGNYYVKKFNTGTWYKISEEGIILDTLDFGTTTASKGIVSKFGNHLLFYNNESNYDESSSDALATLYDGTNVQKVFLTLSTHYSTFIKFMPCKFIKAPYMMVANYKSSDIDYCRYLTAINTCFMSTINNLATEVIKTAVQTMKVTYTLTES